MFFLAFLGLGAHNPICSRAFGRLHPCQMNLVRDEKRESLSRSQPKVNRSEGAADWFTALPELCGSLQPRFRSRFLHGSAAALCCWGNPRTVARSRDLGDSVG